MLRLILGMICGAAVLLLADATPAFAADTVRLTSGWTVEGNITVESESEVKIRVKGRTMSFPRDTIAAIEYGPDSMAPSQVEKREEEERAALEADQQKVEAIKIKKRSSKRKKKKQEDKDEEGELDAVGGGLNPDGTLVIPDQPSPEEEAALALLRSDKPTDRMTGAGQLEQLKSYYAIPNLIRMLDDDNVHARKAAFKALQHITQQSHGYKHDERNRSVRLESVKKWQEWYEQASGKNVPW